MAALLCSRLTVYRGFMPDNVRALGVCISLRGRAHGLGFDWAAILHSA
ncbi:hypothetical protein EV13_1433 [Prochlorococcus sp. MIT 0702]|nr:hypothetical protein EV13_1433 [Prochlorococcus sp. MIT 0702]KGG37149.1 hypothetical protein EV14_0091 [Prochlorococcus sp. MIT 0703]